MASFSAFDLLSMPDSEQQIIRCLNQRPQLTVLEISAATRLPVKDLEGTLERLVGEARLVEQLHDGQRTFSVRFSREATQPTHNRSGGLLSLFEQSDDT